MDSNDGVTFFAITVPLTNVPAKGETYTIVYNNIEYSCICERDEDDGVMMSAWGNMTVFDGGNTGEPFIIVMYDTASEEGIYGMALDITGILDGTGVAATSASIGGITGPVVERQIIDKKFLPEEVNTNIINGIAVGSLRGINAAEETDTYSLGTNSLAFGLNAQASDSQSFAFGSNVVATSGGFAEGNGTIANGGHAEGYNTVAVGTMSHAEGYYTRTAGNYGSHAEGNSTVAYGRSSHAEGIRNTAYSVKLTGEANALTYTVTSTNIASLKVGHIIEYQHTYAKITEIDENTITLDATLSNTAFSSVMVTALVGASGIASHTEGNGTFSVGQGAHAEGGFTNAYSDFSHTEGKSTIAEGELSHAEGYQTKTIGEAAHAEGFSTIALGGYSHVEGSGLFVSTSIEGGEANATEYLIHNQSGDLPIRAGALITLDKINYIKVLTSEPYGGSHNKITVEKTLSTEAFDMLTVYVPFGLAYGGSSHAENYSTAIGIYSHAEGAASTASGFGAHVEGGSCMASGSCAHAGGIDSVASGEYSFAHGQRVQAKGKSSSAEGYDTIALGDNQKVIGRLNIEDNSNYAFIVGNGQGTSNNQYSNAHTVAWDGTGWFQNSVKIGGSGQDDANAKTLATEEYVDNKNFIVNIISRGETEDSDIELAVRRWSVELDKTFDEVLAACKTGKHVECRDVGEDGSVVVYPLIGFGTSGIYFQWQLMQLWNTVILPSSGTTYIYTND